MNSLKVIGDHMKGSGLSEVWVESGLLAPGPAQLVFNQWKGIFQGFKSL